jgi:hypothetical protein
MQIGTQTKQNMVIECKSLKSGSLRQKQQKLNVKKRYRFKKATLYEREVIKSKHFLFAHRSFQIHTTGG